MNTGSKVTLQEVNNATKALRSNGIEPLVATRTQIAAVCNIPQRRARTIKEWIKRGEHTVTLEVVQKEIESLKQAAKNWAIKYKPIVRCSASGNLLEICINDLHNAKFAWSPETGWDGWNLEKSEQAFQDALETIIDRACHIKYEKILLVVGNDYFHVDTLNNTTTKGTPQDVDGRYFNMYTVVRDMTIRAIERLRQIAPVHVLMLSGNHDKLTVFHLGDSLEAWFRNCPDVTVDNSPRNRKYFEWGEVLIGFAHGNRGKMPNDYPLAMVREAKQAYGRCSVWEFHTGDKHQTKVFEQFGFVVRILPSLCPPDAWHSENFFVGNQRRTEAFMWNKSGELLGTAVYTIKD